MKKVRLQKLDSRGIPLKEVILLQKKFRPPQSLSQNLGDGFLMRFNPLFKKIRNETLRRGFSFTTENVGNYYSFPLMALDEVIFRKKIPYRENFAWLPRLESLAPETFTLTEIKRSEIQLNYLFHESAHCIAHAEFFGRQDGKRIPKNEISLLKILLGESFANAVECFSAIYAEGELGFFFLEANCHFRATAKEILALKRSAKKHGNETIFLLLVCAFLYANYLHEELNKKERGKIFSFVGVKPSKELEKILQIGMQLDTEFRTSTTQLHLLKMGFEKKMEKYFSEPMDLLGSHPSIAKKVKGLARFSVF